MTAYLYDWNNKTNGLFIQNICHTKYLPKWSFLVKALGQYPHWKGVSPVCCRTWLTRCSRRVNDLLQKLHLWGDSPVCWRTWFNRCSLRVNVFEQKSQRWGVSPRRKRTKNLLDSHIIYNIVVYPHLHMDKSAHRTYTYIINYIYCILYQMERE